MQETLVQSLELLVLVSSFVFSYWPCFCLRARGAANLYVNMFLANIFRLHLFEGRALVFRSFAPLGIRTWPGAGPTKCGGPPNINRLVAAAADPAAEAGVAPQGRRRGGRQRRPLTPSSFFDLTERENIPVFVRNTPPEKKTLGKTNFQSTRSRCGE